MYTDTFTSILYYVLFLLVVTICQRSLGTSVPEANAADSDRSRAGPQRASRIRHAGPAGMYANHTRQERAQPEKRTG